MKKTIKNKHRKENKSFDKKTKGFFICLLEAVKSSLNNFNASKNCSVFSRKISAKSKVRQRLNRSESF